MWAWACEGGGRGGERGGERGAGRSAPSRDDVLGQDLLRRGVLRVHPPREAEVTDLCRVECQVECRVEVQGGGAG